MSWRARPCIAVLALAGAARVADLAVFGQIRAPPLGWVLYLGIGWIAGHLGLAFFLSAFLATPGCEMRALPHRWTLPGVPRTVERYCPGPLDAFDWWERNRRDP